ncbi:phosphate signaling complex protein PhoU [Bacillus sp. FSL K6-3431]|uniref:phosphate signaling complex protein PhoU n=1 Tax=Bacillus sp. FSL K6-3431 TaxID=2921500 RepID=UPI0030FBFAAF
MAIRSQFDEQLNGLHQQLLTMGMMVEEAVFKSVKSLSEKDVVLAQSIVTGDKAINDAEIAIEKACFSLLALQQPVGGDLRRIATTLKVATDLERMADHAVSIAETTIILKDETYAKPLIDIPKMGEHVQKIVRDSISAYIQLDHKGAYKIALQDDAIDAQYRKVFSELIDMMTKDKQLISQATHLLLVAQYLERIGDYATNICEWIVYMEAGQIVELNN